MKYLDLAIANETIGTIDIKGKEYAEVNQRIKAFRMICPNGAIETELLSNENGICVFKAIVKDETGRILGTGTAFEKQDSSFINKTSYIENCETSAVGRALGMCGLGIDVSVASAEEVQNAINNQTITPEEANSYTLTFGKHQGKTIKQVYEEDKQYIEWILGNKTDERLIKIIELATGIKEPSEDEKELRIDLTSNILKLCDEKEVDPEEVLVKFKVNSISEMSTEQMNKCIGALERKE